MYSFKSYYQKGEQTNIHTKQETQKWSKGEEEKILAAK